MVGDAADAPTLTLQALDGADALDGVVGEIADARSRAIVRRRRQLAGRDDIRVTNAAAVAGLRECQVTLRHLLEDGRLGFAEGRFEAVDVDGNRMDFPFAMVVEMSGDGIGRLSEYFDTRTTRGAASARWATPSSRSDREAWS